MTRTNLTILAAFFAAAAAAPAQTPKFDPNQYYSIINLQSSTEFNPLSLTVDDKGGISLGNSQPESLWMIRPWGDGSGRYRLSNAQMGRSWSIDSDPTTPHMQPTGNFTGQLWTLTPVGGSNTFQLSNAFQPGKVMTIGPSYLAQAPPAGTQVYLDQPMGVPTEWWTIVPAIPNPSPAAQVAQANNSSQYLRLRNQATGAYLNNEHGLATGSVKIGWYSAMWDIRPVAGAPEPYWTIQNYWTGEYLNMQGGNFQLSAAQPNDESAMWYFQAQPEGSWRISNRLYSESLALSSTYASGAPAANTPKPSDLTAQWWLEPQSATPGAALSPMGIHVSVVLTGKCLDFQPPNLYSAPITGQWGCDNTKDTQNWTEKFVEAPWALYVNAGTGQCLQAPAGNTNPGAALQLATCDASKRNQHFQFEAISGAYQIVSRQSSLCLNISGASRDDGGALIQWTCLDSAQNNLFTRSYAQAPTTYDKVASAVTYLNTQILGIQDPDPDTCWKNTSTRGAGTPLDACPADHPDWDGAGLCYKSCAAGYHSNNITMCIQSVTCPDGWYDDGLSCWKKNGNPFLSCPAGTTDLGFWCARNSYDRGVGVPMVCKSGEQQSGALCYPPCPSGTDAVAFVCWGHCGGNYPTDCGAACAKSTEACVESIVDQVLNTAETVLNVADLILTGGEGGPALKAAEKIGNELGERAVDDATRVLMQDTLKAAINKAKSFANPDSALQAAQNALDTADGLNSLVTTLQGAYQNGTFDWTALVPAPPTVGDAIADFDPTGVFSGMISIVKSFNKPICH